VTELPRRPFTELSPPPSGGAHAVRRGRRLRRRRNLAGAGAAVGSLVAMAVSALLIQAHADSASDVLIPARPSPGRTATAVSRPATAPRLAPTPGVPLPATAPGPLAATSGATAGGSAQGTAPRAVGSGNAHPTARPAKPSYRTPDLVRRYTPPPAAPGARLCGDAVSGTGTTVQRAPDWCTAAIATKTSSGHQLSIEVCSDSAGGGPLHFDRRREAELVVRDSSGVLWRWSVGHPDGPSVHALNTEPNACWTWTAAWTDVDSSGKRLDPGRYTLEVASQARELRTVAVSTTTLQVR
jgi:hypothetical protein